MFVSEETEKTSQSLFKIKFYKLTTRNLFWIKRLTVEMFTKEGI